MSAESDSPLRNLADTVKGYLGPAEVETDLGVEEIMTALGNRRRRLAVKAVAQSEDILDIGGLSETVGAMELGKPRAQVTSTERKRYYVGMYQTHLPRLEDAGVVVVERNGGVRPGENLEAATAVLRAVESLVGADDCGAGPVGGECRGE